ncbi:MAG: AAA family ATPase, partial [Peptococcaceae bacterium]|nr:AAA family ATPase [Peptococcaceae bacterium]
ITSNDATADNVSAGELAQLAEVACIPSQLDTYVRMVKEASIRRKLISFSRLAAHKSTENAPLEQVLSDVENAWFELTKEQSTDYEMNHQVMLKTLKIIEDRYRRKGITGVKTGFPELDNVTGGWQPGQLIFLGAVPKMGKTSMGQHFAINSGVPTLFFTLEMLPEEIGDRQISAAAKVDGKDIRTGRLDAEQWQAVTAASAELSGKPIGWVKKSDITVTEMRAVCRRFQAEHGLGLVVIDQLDKIREKAYPGEKKTDTIGRVTKQLKNMARDLEVPVICLVQLLDKQVTSRSTPRPTFGDIRDSSCPEQDGDVIMFLWRPEFYFPQKQQFKGKAEIIVARQRAGPPASVWVWWEPRFTSFADMARALWPKESEISELRK